MSEPAKETAQACVQRFMADGKPFQLMAGEGLSAVYTFDLNGLSLVDFRDMMPDRQMPGKLVNATGPAEAAAADFMKQEVDEKGALLIAGSKYLYRVRLSSLSGDQIVKRGCAMAEGGMRLVSIEAIINEKTDS